MNPSEWNAEHATENRLDDHEQRLRRLEGDDHSELEKTAAALTYGVHRSIDQHDDPTTRRALALLIARNLIDAAATTELPPPRDKIILDGLLDHEPGCRAPDYGPCTCTAETQERLRAARENKP